MRLLQPYPRTSPLALLLVIHLVLTGLLRGQGNSPATVTPGSPNNSATLASPANATAVPAAPSASDVEWNKLIKQAEARGKAAPTSTPPAKSSPPGAGNRAEQAAAFLAQANQFKDFQAKYPDHAAVKQAKQKEAVSLSLAALSGDTSQDARRQALLEVVRRDSALTPLVRFEAVAWNHQVSVARQPTRTRPSLLAAHENSGRQLIAEFPTLPNGYESLLAVARDSAPDRGQIIARDVLLMAAPVAIKAEAQLVLDRFALIGRSLSAVLAAANANSLLSRTTGAPAIVYTWKAANASSLQAARRLAKQAPRAVLIGLCLDSDLAAARQTALREKLPGSQFPDTGNSAAALTGALKLNRAASAYLIDRAGTIRDVQGLDDTAAKLARFGF